MMSWSVLLLASAIVVVSGQMSFMEGSGPYVPFWNPFGLWSPWGVAGGSFAARDLEHQTFFTRIISKLRTVLEVLKRIPDFIFITLYFILTIAFPLRFTHFFIESIHYVFLVGVRKVTDFLLLPSQLPMLSVIYSPIALIVRILRFILNLIINIIGTPLAGLVQLIRKIVTHSINFAHTVTIGVLSIPLNILNFFSPTAVASRHA